MVSTTSPARAHLDSIGDDAVEAVIVKTLEEMPIDATHWSTRSMAKDTGMSQSAVSRIWRAFGLKPHLVESFKLSPDPQFMEKVRDIVGLYVNPPEGALVLCVDEKIPDPGPRPDSPVLPLRPGLPERQTHDYRRHGTTNLYAALDVASGKVIADHHRAPPGRRSSARFLNLINRNVPEDLDVHVVVDNSSTHKTPEIQRWLVRHPRFTSAFHPHLQLVAEPHRALVRRADQQVAPPWHPPLDQRTRISASPHWTDHWNDEPQPFVWHKTADEILDTLAAYCAADLRLRSLVI